MLDTDSLYIFDGRVMDVYLSKDERTLVWVFYSIASRKPIKVVSGDKDVNVTEIKGQLKTFALIGYRPSPTASYCRSVAVADWSTISLARLPLIA